VNGLELEKELVAISFISPEDLERIHAPNGVFREVDPSYLHPHEEARTLHVAGALDALEGKSPESQPSSRCTTSPTEKEDRPGYSLKFEDLPQATNPQSSGIKKSSSIRKLFRRTKSEPQLESSKPPIRRAIIRLTCSDLKQRSSFRRAFRRDSAGDEALIMDGRLMLSAVLQTVSTAANKGDLKTVRKECDRLMAMTPPSNADTDYSPIPIHAFSFPDGTLIQDTAGNSRYISAETVNEITSALRHTPVASLAKTKVSVLSTRAYLSAQDEAYEDAFRCYRHVLDLLREHPMLFPDVIWHAAILSNLAHLSSRLKRPDDEEKYYLKALAISYNRYGRKDLNNINFLTALANAYETNDQTARAAEVYKRSLFARMEISGPGENDTLMAMQELAAVYCKLNCLETSKLLYEQCLVGFETRLGLDHKVTLLIVDRLCNVHLQLQTPDEALALYVRAFPHLRKVCDPDESLSRTWLSQYIQHTKNFDFPPEVSVFLQSYRSHPTEQNLWILQTLARFYMLAGLLPDASELFEFVYNARRKLRGEYDPPALDALHGHCLALECMDSVNAAHNAYTNLIQLALRSPDSKDGKMRAINVRTRLGALQERKKVLAGEKEAWGLKHMGPCSTCKYQTNLLCQKCHITRFCCEACRDLSSRSHDLSCHPSVTLCQSKSVTAVPGVPQRIERQVIERLASQTIRRGQKAKLYRVSNSYTFNYDPRNFSTFRVKFNSQVDTYVCFNLDADIRFAVLDPSPPRIVAAAAQPASPSPNPANTLPFTTTKNINNAHLLRPPLHGEGSEPPSSRTSTETDPTTTGLSFPPATSWSTPRETETLLLPRGKDVYLVVAPGEKLLSQMVTKRRGVRAQDTGGWENLEVPDEAVIRYAQGLVLKGMEKCRFAYLVEVVS
jgi:tetratricopeptide (TPR) repeat protein